MRLDHMVVDAFDEVYAYGRQGTTRYACYLDDLSPEVVARIYERVPMERGSVYLSMVDADVDWRLVD